ncbi:hypothetical protein R83H12_01680 [Fibrobacteria bacterium R8-3-H12]
MLNFLNKLAWMPLAVAPLLGGCFFFDDPNKAETAADDCKVYMRNSNGQGWTYVKETEHPVLEYLC